MNKQSSWGGKRRGAGRKHLSPGEPTVRITIFVSQSQHDWLTSKDNMSEAIRNLIQKEIDRERQDLHD